MKQETEKHFEQLYFKHAKMIEHFANEVITIKEKFGDRSQLYQSKIKSLQFMRQFHDETIGYFETIEKAFINLQAAYNMQRIQLVSAQCKIPVSDAIKHVQASNEAKLNLDNCNLIVDRLQQHLSDDLKLTLDRLTQETYA